MIIDNYSMAVPVVATPDVAGTVGYFERTLGLKQPNGYHLKIAELDEPE